MNGKLKAIRESKGLSQSDLAKLANVDISYISKIETGKRNPSIAMLERLAHALDVSAKDFFK